KSLVQYAKLFGLVLSIFFVIGVILYYLDVKKLREDMEAIHHESQKLDLDIKEAQFTLKKQLTEMDEIASKIKSDAESAAKSGEQAKSALSSTQEIEHRAKESLPTIEGARAQAVIFMEGISKSPQLPASNPIQIENFVDAIIIKVFKDILPNDSYIRLQT